MKQGTVLESSGVLKTHFPGAKIPWKSDVTRYSPWEFWSSKNTFSRCWNSLEIGWNKAQSWRVLEFSKHIFQVLKFLGNRMKQVLESSGVLKTLFQGVEIPWKSGATRHSPGRSGRNWSCGTYCIRFGVSCLVHASVSCFLNKCLTEKYHFSWLLHAVLPCLCHSCPFPVQ